MTRRQVLVAAGAAAALASHASTAGTKPAASPIGAWASDPQGLPTYRFTADLPVSTRTPAGQPYPLEPDPYFLLGNEGISLFTHASGLLLLMSGERGWVRLNSAAAGAESNGAVLTVMRDGVRRQHKLLGLTGACASASTTEREFGCGFARWRITPEPGLLIERTLSVAPSTAGSRGEPAFVVSVRITNRGSETVDADYAETLLSNPTLALNRAPVGGQAPVRFKNSARALPGGWGVICDATPSTEDPTALVAPHEPSRYNLYPPSLVLLAEPHVNLPVTFSQRELPGGAIELQASTQRLRLLPGQSHHLVFVVALKPQDSPLDRLLAFTGALSPSLDGTCFRQAWVQALSTLIKVPDAALRDELTWDGHALLAMATYSAYYGETFIPQGMTYDYHLDLTAAPRDHLQHALAAAYFAPALAKSTIRYTLCKMTYQGEIKYTDFGFGETSNSAWNTSDQQLYLFQTLGEYLRITQDWSILEDKTTYLTREANFRGTTLEKVARAFSYLRDEVATGPHGLVRLMNSDWSDMVYVDTPVMHHFFTAESQMNSGMVMAVMPNLIEQLRLYGRSRGGDTAAFVMRLCQGMQLYVDRISQAMLRDMEGRTFAKRVHLDANTSTGVDTMHLEPQAFLLQAGAFPVARKKTLWRELQSRLLAGEALGPRQREKPVVGGTMQPGVSENGGFWYALAGQTVIGVATFDPAAALGLLKQMTFRNFAKRHPDYWVGQWTAPDTINAAYCGDFAGLPRPDNDGLWMHFAVYCAHAHAWPIYSYYRIKDLA